MESILLTKSEVAATLRVSPRTIDNYVRTAILPKPIRLGRRALWRQKDIQARIDQAAGEA